MSSNFDWQAEDEDSWTDLPPQVAAAKPFAWRRLLPPALLLLSLLLAGGLLARYFQGRVDEAANEARDELLTSHRLMTTAASQGDRELFELLVSDQKPAWQETQMALLADGLFLERTGDLQWQGVAETAVEVTFSPDWLAAEVVYYHTYTATPPTAAAVTVSLAHTAVYRRAGDRWLLAPPDATFWGEQLTWNGRFFTLSYPERDAWIVERLAVDLDTTLADACASVAGLRCPRNLELPIVMDTTPAALMDLAQLETARGDGPAFRLPSPTLFGLPADEAGYQALHRAYASRILARFIAGEANWTCCRQALFHQALLDKQLQQLGLRKWPLSPDDYLQMLNHPVDLREDIRPLWQNDPPRTAVPDQPDQRLIYALVDFLVAQPAQASILALQQHLASRPSFNRWLMDAAGSEDIDSEIAPTWHRFLQEQILAAQTAAPLPWPEQDLLLLCDGDGTASSIHRYNPRAYSWHLEIGERPFFYMSSLADYSGVLLAEHILSRTSQTILWRNGQEITLLTGPGAWLRGIEGYGNMATASDHARQRQAVQYNDFTDFTQPVSYVALLDLEQCAESCSWLELAGFPAWSPNGRQTILIEMLPLNNNSIPLLFRADGDGRQPIPVGAGISPFWLDDDTYGYLPADSPQRIITKVVIASTGDDRLRTLLTADDLLTAVPQATGGSRLILQQAVTSPAAPGLLFVTARDEVTNEAYLFAYDWRSGSVSRLLALAGRPSGYWTMAPSLDGRWLTVLLNNREKYTTAYFYDLIDARAQEYQLYASLFNVFDLNNWSADEQWLARLHPDGLILMAPAAGYQYLAPHHFSGCVAVAWVNPQ
jgi:hypothetical protein